MTAKAGGAVPDVQAAGALRQARILNLGGCAAVEICADLLRQAGATIETGRSDAHGAFDIVLWSSDELGVEGRRSLAAAHPDAIRCDISATHPGTGGMGALDDAVLQARSGLMDVTGFTAGLPTATTVPMVDLSAALYAASVIAALRLSGSAGISVQVSRLGCAVSALTTFLPQAFLGQRVGRMGNRHPACAPWNAYPTHDGYVLICTSSDEQWGRLRARMNHASLLDPGFDRLEDRVVRVDEIDDRMRAWTSTLTTAACLDHCEAAGIAAGPIIASHRLWEEANFRTRHPEAAALQRDGANAAAVLSAINLIRATPLVPQSPARRLGGIGGALPLSGLRVLELGQYTATPLATKHLAMLGAQVIKVEPPKGEVTRRWQPTRDGMSYYFAITNSGKALEFLDLSGDEGRQRLAQLIGSAHVLIENMRPGALAGMGFDPPRLAALNPALVYCSVSGFGAYSAYPRRPAFDTVVQAMTGLMDLTPSAGQPVKLGVSAADILGAQAALFAILTSLPEGGLFVDVAMQDVTAWAALAAERWPSGHGRILSCLDGTLWLEGRARTVPDEAALALLPRVLAQRRLANAGVQAHRISRVDELLLDPLIEAQELAVADQDGGGLWPTIQPPYRIEGCDLVASRIPAHGVGAEAGGRSAG